MTDSPTFTWSPVPDDAPFQLPPSRHPRMSEQVATWVEAALQANALGDTFTWDVAVQPLATPEGPVPGLMIVVQLPSPILGAQLAAMTPVAFADATEDNVGRAVAHMVEQLRQARSQQLRT